MEGKYDVIIFVSIYLYFKKALMMSAKLQPCLSKQPLKTQTKLKELKIIY